ncbi:MAG: TlpA disulfide reductase family protein [Ginsengibacter sp.]
MRKFVFFFLIVPVLGFAQSKSIATKPVSDGFVITGNVTGYPDGTAVSFLDEQTNKPEKQGTIQNGKFNIKGRMIEPGFKGLIFGDQPPLVPLFLDNSNISVSGDKQTIDQLVVTGSPTHTLYSAFTKEMKPFESLTTSGKSLDKEGVSQVEKISADFVKQNPGSYVSPLAIIRMYQMTENGKKAEELFKLLPSALRSGSLGQYANHLIEESKINPIGSVIQNFSQADTTGKEVNFTTYRGKYVLLDFWASWCRPCRMENPNVVAAYNKYRDKNFTVLGISLDQAKAAWVNAIHVDGLTWGHVSDLKGWNNEVAALFHVRSIPQNLLIDPDGKIIAKNLRGDVLENKLEELLK